MIDEPNIENQEDGSYTKNLVKSIMQEILPYMGIYPTGELTEEEQQNLGMQVDREPETEMVAQYVYDEWGNIMYDETTWEPLTELVPVEVTESEYEADNVYGNVAPPTQSDDGTVDENQADAANPEEYIYE